MDEKKTIQEMGADAKLLIARLDKIEAGEIVPYAELSEVIGRDIRKHRGALYTAMNSLRRDGQKVFGTMRGEGLKRLDDSGILQSAEGTIPSIHRTIRRGMKTLACSNYDHLDNEEKIRHNATASHCGALLLATKPAATKRLMAAVAEKHEELPTARTLELFSK